MSYYAGFSLREVYKKRCVELQCAANSAVMKALSDVPDDFQSLTSLDLSRNFVGTKGVVPLLDVVECAKSIRSLDLRNQELGNEAVAIICARLRRHPSLQKLNMSDNPITLAVGTDLLELAKNNPVLQYIYLDRTLVRPSMVTVIEVQLEKNRQLATSPTSAPAKSKAELRPSPSLVEATTPAAEVAVAGAAGSNDATKTSSSTPSPPAKPHGGPTAAGGGASAAVALARSGTASVRGAVAERKRCPPHEIQHVLRGYTHALSDVLFDVDPTNDLWDWCESHYYFFDDDQFSSRNDDLHRTARHTYGIAGWRRVGELYPQATLFGAGGLSNLCGTAAAHSSDADKGGEEGEERTRATDNYATAITAAAASGLLPEASSLLLQLPSDVPEGFTWTFTSVVASVRDIQSLKALLCCAKPSATTTTAAATPGSPPFSPATAARLVGQKGTNIPGLYVMRLHVEGVWRFLIVDDFLPVDKFGRLIFTKPALNDTAFWPCIVEKMLAKLYGGYHVLDAHFDEHHAGIDGPMIRKPIAWNYLSRENLRRATDGSAAVTNPLGGEAGAPSFFMERLAGNCGRVMAQLTSGFYDSHRLHPIEETTKGRWWDILLKALAPPRPTRGGNPFSRDGSVLPPANAAAGATGRSVNAGRYGGGPSGKPSMFGGAGRASAALSIAAHSTMTSALHTGVVAFSRGASHTTNGIHPSTAYQVMRVCHVNGVRLLMLRNPWCGAVKWSGDWADDSPLWKKNPEIADMLLQRSSTLAGAGESIRGLSEATAYARGDSSVLTLQSNLKRSLMTAMRSSVGDASSTAPPSASLSGTSFQGEVAHVAKSTFWMSYTDFLQNFEWVHLCRVFSDDEFYRRDFHGEWTCETAGGNVMEPTWHTNPHYRLVLPHRTTVRLQLSRRDVGLQRTRAAVANAAERGEGGIGMQVLRDAYYPLHCPPPTGQNSSAPFILSTCVAEGSPNTGSVAGAAAASFSTLIYSAATQVGDHLTVDLTLDAGSQYWIVPTTHAPRTLDQFNLSIVTTASFQIQEAAESQYWDTRTAPAETLVASSSPQVSQSDGELAVVFNARARVLMDAVALFLQSESTKRAAQHGLSSTGGVSAASPLAPPPTQQRADLPCRVVVTATMEAGDNDEETADFGFDDAYEERLIGQDGSFEQTPSVSLAIVPGEVDTEGNPSRTIGEIEAHPSNVFAIGQHTVLETEIAPAAEHEVEYYTAICSPRPAGTRALISYRVWCAAPLLEVRSLPKWAKQEIAVSWDDPRGSGNFYDCDGHPQIELAELQPYQRFTVSLRMLDYDTITPAIMFSIIRDAQHTGEPITGRVADNELFARSEYVDETEVQASFELGGVVPASLLLIPCLQPTGSQGRGIVTVSSDSAHFRARALCGGNLQ